MKTNNAINDFKVTFLGSGSAFYIGAQPGENWQSNVLIDCGTDIRFSLLEHGLGAKDIDDVFISHLHGDHVGGLEWLAFSTRFSASKRKPGIWANQMVMKDLWSHSLRGGLGSLEGEVATMRTYFEVHSIPNNKGFEWEGVFFRLVQVVHNVDGFKICPTFGLLFDLGSTRIFFTADTQFAPAQISQYYRSADLILHDCETSPFKSGVHAHYDQLIGLPDDVKRKMWLYHYQSGPKSDACADGFAGWIEKGKCFIFPAESVAAA